MSGQRSQIEPIPGPEAFEHRTRQARFSQAALILSVAAGVAGEAEGVEETLEFPLPSLPRLYRADKLTVAEACDPLPVDTASYLRGEVGEISQFQTAQVARRLYDDPAPDSAAALVEAGLHSRSRLVRTASAAAAIDTTGPREDTLAELEQAVFSPDPTTRDLARTALARISPQHEALGRVVTKPLQIRPRLQASHTAVITHGTFAAHGRWWRPGGSFYEYLDGLQPPLHLHSSSFRWSGAYSDGARQLASDQLVQWMDAEGLERPDLFAHSHGATVANLATRSGLRLRRLVMLAWPVHEQWIPDLAAVDEVISLRVHLDLVILVDRGHQRLPASFQASSKVHEHVDGWFSHSAPHDPEHWQRHGLSGHL